MLYHKEMRTQRDEVCRRSSAGRVPRSLPESLDKAVDECPHRIVSPPFVECAYHSEELGVVALPREARGYRWLIDQVGTTTASRALGQGNSVAEVARFAAREDGEANDLEGTLE